MTGIITEAIDTRIGCIQIMIEEVSLKFE